MSVFLSAWEQRKVSELLEERTEKAPENKIYPLMAFIANKGVAPKGDRYDRAALVKDAKNKKYKRTKLGDFIYSSNNLETGSIGLNNYGNASISPVYSIFKPTGIANSDFIGRRFVRKDFINLMIRWRQGVVYGQWRIHEKDFLRIDVSVPSLKEQQKIGNFLSDLDSLITLHQRKSFIKNGGIKMITSSFTCDSLFKDYFEFWIKLYKEGAVRPVTLEKYRNNQKHIAKIIPNLKMKDFDRNAYQELLNQYALTHERQTVIDFHHQVKGAILDAVDDGLIDRDPTRKAIFKGKAPREKKQKYLNQFELHNLLEDLDLGMEITWDWLILLIAKTGLRFSEALGLTPADFDFARQTISVNKTWDYKTNTGFQPTKNRSSIRKVQMDWQLGMQFQHLIKNLNEDEPIFVNGPVCNSTPNNCLARHCRKCGIPEISIHGLRHTHASLLMFAGVSIASVSRRLGHSSITTTQKVYMHIISELENQDNDLVMRYLSSLS